MLVTGPVTLATVGALLEAGRGMLRQGATSVDLGEVTELDSSLLAVVLCWMRDARAANGGLRLERAPEGMSSLAALYGVDGLLNGAPSAR